MAEFVGSGYLAGGINFDLTYRRSDVKGSEFVKISVRSNDKSQKPRRIQWSTRIGEATTVSEEFRAYALKRMPPLETGIDTLIKALNAELEYFQQEYYSRLVFRLS